MLQGLQVSFRGLTPSESLMTLADRHYRMLVGARPELAECLIWLDAPDGASGCAAHAVVRAREHGPANAEAHARHRDPHVALALALGRLQTRLGLGSGELR